MAVYADRSDHDANQGDVFEAVPFGGFTIDGMVTSHDCVCDKYLEPRTPLSEEAAAEFPVSVAPVHPLDQLTDDWRAAVLRDRMPRYFLLPAEGERPDLVADLYLEQPVRFAEVLDCDRATSLSPEWLARLWQQFMRLRFGEDYMTFIRKLLDAS